MFCNQCGKEMKPGAGFCANCGAPAKKTEDRVQKGQPAEPVYADLPYDAVGEPDPQPQPRPAKPTMTGPIGAVKEFFANYVNFKGRATRSEYWWSTLFTSLLTFAASFIPPVGLGMFALLVVPGFAVAVRRLHDIGKSGWNLLWSLLPIAGAIVLLVFFCMPSRGENEWGPTPV